MAAIGLPACYLIWVMKGCKLWMPFISDFDLSQPEAALFTSIGSLCPLLVSIGMVTHFRERSVHLQNISSHRGWWIIESITLGLGLSCCAFVIAIAHLTWTEYFILHGLLATLFFYCGTAWVVTLSMGTWHTSSNDKKLLSLLKIRSVFAILALLGLIGMVSQIPIYFSSNSFIADEYLSLGRDVERFCRTTLHPSINLAAAFEWLLVMSIIGVTTTLAFDQPTTNADDSVE